MKKRTAPGILMTIIGVALFAYLGIGQTMRRNLVQAGSAIRSSRSIQANAMQMNEQGFPISSLLAGFLFMSGISLVAIGAQQELHRKERIQAPRETRNS
jgi:hypothetical protein